MPCLLCKQKDLECEYIKVDKRTLKGQRKGSRPSIPENEISVKMLEEARTKDQNYTRSSKEGSLSTDMGFPEHSPGSIVNDYSSQRQEGPIRHSLVGSQNGIQYNRVGQANSTVTQNNKRNIPQNNRYLPKNLEPLLSFPIEEENQNNGHGGGSVDRFSQNTYLKNAVNDDTEDDYGLSNEEGKNTRLLRDSGGNLRYIGESSPLSLLFECRNIFYKNLGHTKFTDDPRRMSIVDQPGKLASGIPIQLPTREECDTLVEVFEENINYTFYVFDSNYLRYEIVDFIYKSPNRAPNNKLALLHLVLALGSLFAQISPDYSIKELCNNDSAAYFESGSTLIRNSEDSGGLWVSEAYFLIYFYYQSTCKRSTSWLMLNVAIKNAQALGLHRKFINESFKDIGYVNHRRLLWQSLYICDRISSILLGRPLSIGDYDWDDIGTNAPQGPLRTNDDFRAICQMEMAKIAKINGKIVENFYGEGKINTNRARKLAIELKKWSITLRSEMKIDRLLTWDETLSQDMYYPLLLTHLSQLYGIVLLSRPFFMYSSFQKQPTATEKVELTLTNFRNACIKASILTIKFVDHFLAKCPMRMELFTTINCCFNSALILGLQILHEKVNEAQGKNTEYNVVLLMDTLDKARNTLSNYGPMSATSARFSDIIGNMQSSLKDKFSIPADNGAAQMQVRVSATPIEASSMGFNDIGEKNLNGVITPSFNIPPDLDNLLDFQQFFLPPESTSPSNTETSDKQDMLDLFMQNLGKSDILFDNRI